MSGSDPGRVVLETLLAEQEEVDETVFVTPFGTLTLDRAKGVSMLDRDEGVRWLKQKYR